MADVNTNTMYQIIVVNEISIESSSHPLIRPIHIYIWGPISDTLR